MLSDPSLWGEDGVSGLYWLADGRIVYTDLDSSSDGSYNIWAIMVDPNSGMRRGQAERLTNWRQITPYRFSASADGKRLVTRKLSRKNSAYIMDLKSSSKNRRAQRLLGDSWDNLVTGWTADSDAVLFDSNRNGKWAIFRKAIGEEAPKVVISGAEHYTHAIPSSTGSRILYRAEAKHKSMDSSYARLMSVLADGGSASTLATGPYSYQCGTLPGQCAL